MAYGKKPKDDNENKGRGRRGPKPIKGARKAARKQKREEKKTKKKFQKAVDRLAGPKRASSKTISREGVILPKPTVPRKIERRFEKQFKKSNKQQYKIADKKFKKMLKDQESDPRMEMMKEFIKSAPMKEPTKKQESWHDYPKPPNPKLVKITPKKQPKSKPANPALKAPGMKAQQSSNSYQPSERDRMHATDFGKRSINKNPSMKVIGKELAAGAKVAADKIKQEKGMSTTDKGIMSRYGGAEAASVTRRKAGGMVKPPRRQAKRK